MKRIHLLMTIILMAFLLSGCGPLGTITGYFSISADPTYFTQAGETITLTYAINVKAFGDIDSDGGYSIQISEQYENSDCSQSKWVGYFNDIYYCTVPYTTTEEDVANGMFFHTNTVIVTARRERGCGNSLLGTYSAHSVTASIEVPYVDPAILDVSIYSLPPTFSRVGEDIRYTFTIRNIGSVPANEPVTIEDSLLDVDCPNIPPLDPQEHITCTASYTSTTDDLVAGIIRNTSVAVSGLFHSEPAIHDIPIDPQPALSLEITASPNFYAFEGETIAVSYEVTNTGNVPLSGPFEIIAENLLDWSCPAGGSLAIGEMLTCTGSIRITQAEYGYHFTHHAQVQGVHAGQTVQSQVASVTISFSPPFTEPEPAFNCSALPQGLCYDYPDACYWDSVGLVCRNK